MNLNKYHKKVLAIALDIFEHNGDDSWMDVCDDPKLFRAFNQLNKASTSICSKRPKEPKIPKGAIIMGTLTSKDVS